MGTFTKNTVTKGKFKSIIACEDGTFMDDESGQTVELAKLLYQTYGDSPFELTTTLKVDEDV